MDSSTVPVPVATIDQQPVDNPPEGGSRVSRWAILWFCLGNIFMASAIFALVGLSSPEHMDHHTAVHLEPWEYGLDFSLSLLSVLACVVLLAYCIHGRAEDREMEQAAALDQRQGDQVIEEQQHAEQQLNEQEPARRNSEGGRCMGDCFWILGILMLFGGGIGGGSAHG